MTHVVTVPTVLNVGPFTEEGRVSEGSCPQRGEEEADACCHHSNSPKRRPLHLRGESVYVVTIPTVLTVGPFAEEGRASEDHRFGEGADVLGLLEW